MQPCKSFFLILKFLVLLVTNIEGIDVFCGQLEIFNEQRFGQGAITVSSQTTTDMKQCLDVCCSIPNCDGVTFEGITSTDFDDSNCLLVSCEPECQFNGPSTQHSSGVLSVLIHRIRNETTTPPTPSTTKSSYIPEIRAALTPFWVLAVAIGVAAICVGLNVTLCVAYCCYCRRKKRSQKAHISTVKGGPTLHAFNPQV
ncbi:MANSC domain-containing protein [Caenorhabditis elegans]|uniref:MANSC domain-containing protein n=1 Tax=Caenorhabditis elegans TaxID=6239 RepID=Q4W5S0_CAEEL|nr:Seven cysteines N-terminal domain-containing protein [Caenorhabditis elegans]CCD72576.2 Seven cysteines N-terminal domain-containing protein [Caenorhabditis elegans]